LTDHIEQRDDLALWPSPRPDFFPLNAVDAGGPVFKQGVTPMKFETVYMMVLAVVLFVGCDDSATATANPNDALIGGWYVELGSGCFHTLLFIDDGVRYERNVTCVNAEATHSDIQAEVGEYAADGEKVVFTPKQWTCAGSIKPTTAAYELKGERLTLATKAGATIFAAAPEIPAGTKLNATITLGCYDADGEFEAHEIHKL
jgi:hypothetical protein